MENNRLFYNSVDELTYFNEEYRWLNLELKSFMLMMRRTT